MKKKLFSFLAGILLSASAFAQLPAYSVAPDWTMTDIDGQSHTLYSYLDSGYTVVLDFSAAWCGPCWGYHTSGALEDFYTAHGPAGDNTARVFYIEGESTNTIAQLNGITGTTGSAYADNTQGDWVTGTDYPIIDNATQNGPYAIGYFPTIYMICPNRLISEVGQQPAATLETLAAACPGVISDPNDALMLLYTGDNFSYCGTADVAVKIQNHGTNTLTSLSFNIMDGATSVGTYNWAGSLASGAVADVSCGTFTFSGTNPISVAITTSDDDMLNNALADISIMINGSTTFPFTEGVEDAADLMSMPSNCYQDEFAFPIFNIEQADFTTSPGFDIGGYGASAHSFLWDFFSYDAGASSIVFDKIDLPIISVGDSLICEFTYAYCQYSTENDKLEVLASTDCGATWASKFNKAGSALATAPANTGFFVPDPATDWVTVRRDLSSMAATNDVMLKFRGTSNYGNALWLDDIKVYHKTPSGIKNISLNSSLNVYPNPAAAQSVVNIDLKSAGQVTIEVIDALGKIVYANNYTSVVGSNQFAIDLSNNSNGVYFVKVSSVDGEVSQRIVKAD